jgi:hypothetical protein
MEAPMAKLDLQSTGFFDESYRILTLPRGKGRRHSHHLIIIETLRTLTGPQPTRDELQKLVRIQRKRFLKLLKYLQETGNVERIGNGSKGDPYRYQLGEKNRR